MGADRKQAVIDRLDILPVVRDLFPVVSLETGDQVKVNCPFHEDDTPSLSINTAKGLFHCFGCPAEGNIFDLYMKVKNCDFKTALHDLEARAGISRSSASPSPLVKPRLIATFTYTDANGKRLYVKERWEPARDGKRSKEFFFAHFDDAGHKVKGYKGVHVLYRLHEVVKARQVLIVEGEKKADLLASWGLVATCLDTGAESKWKQGYSPCLKDKDVVILPDADEAGEAYLTTVANGLRGVARSIKVLRLPGLVKKGDVLDWVKLDAAKPDPKASFLVLLEAADSWGAVEDHPPAGGKSVDLQNAETGKRRRAPSGQPEESGGGRGAERLIPLLENCPIYSDDTGIGHILLNDKLQALDTKNRELTEELTYLYWEVVGKPLAKEAANTAITYYAAKARRDGEGLELFNRVGERDGVFFYDLGNGRAVEISPGSWGVIAAPVIFRQMNHQLPQPDPQSGGNPWRFFDFCRIPAEMHLLTIVALCTCFIPRINHPAIHFTGTQGAGKSFASRLLKLLVDPSAVMLSSLPRKPEDLDLLLYRYHLLTLDNLSGLSAELSDRLCSFISGGAIEKRTLHTDLETTVLKSNCIIAFSSITSLHDRPDLHERTIKITLERIPKRERKTEKRLLREFGEVLPCIMGGVFDLLASAMKLMPEIEERLEELPRMADFALWGFAIAEAMGGRGTEFLRDYTGQASMQTAELLENNTFFSTIVQAMERPDGLCGTFAEALSILREIAAPGSSRALEKDRSFPQNPRSFRKHLDRLRVPLEDLGITYTIEEHRTNKGRVLVEFCKREPESEVERGPVDLGDLVFDDTEIEP